MTSREDRTLTVLKPSGVLVVEHSDCTRITTLQSLPQGRYEAVIDFNPLAVAFSSHKIISIVNHYLIILMLLLLLLLLLLLSSKVLLILLRLRPQTALAWSSTRAWRPASRSNAPPTRRSRPTQSWSPSCLTSRNASWNASPVERTSSSWRTAPCSVSTRVEPLPTSAEKSWTRSRPSRTRRVRASRKKDRPTVRPEPRPFRRRQTTSKFRSKSRARRARGVKRQTTFWSSWSTLRDKKLPEFTRWSTERTPCWKLWTRRADDTWPTKKGKRAFALSKVYLLILGSADKWMI